MKKKTIITPSLVDKLKIDLRTNSDPVKKTWIKPILISNKEIGFFGFNNQSSPPVES